MKIKQVGVIALAGIASLGASFAIASGAAAQSEPVVVQAPHTHYFDGTSSPHEGSFTPEDKKSLDAQKEREYREWLETGEVVKDGKKVKMPRTITGNTPEDIKSGKAGIKN